MINFNSFYFISIIRLYNHVSNSLTKPFSFKPGIAFSQGFFSLNFFKQDLMGKLSWYKTNMDVH